ncbi:restriction endonuclease subunit S [Bacteroides acidifaciens]|uniref:restriction endonuclease subunit S n=1 Tax=Bacteroides acidifaciens TaxID=85831 RepID=UPI0025B51473|nr:restriction endonuclease subunit S [Bacteroides acidifaciens]
MVTYPKDWDESKLLDHVSLVQGLTYTPENVKPTGTLVLRSSNIQNGRLWLEDNVYVNAHVPKEKMVEQGDILVCVRNGSSALIGKSCVLPELKHTTFGAFMSVLRGDSTGYFAKLFESNIVQEQVRGRSNATINQITKKDFQSIQVTVPKKPEQEEIARTLSQFDTYIDDLAELIEKKKSIRDGALEDLITKKTRLDGYAGDWTPVTFNQVITPKARIGWQGLKKHEYLRSGYSYLIGGTDFSNGTVSLDNISYVTKERYDMDTNIQVSENDVLVTKDGTIGKIAIVPELNKPATLNSGVFVFRTNSRLVPAFLFRVLQSSVFREFIDTLSAGSTIKHLYQKDLKKFEFEIPVDTKEQEAISAVLTAMDEEIRDLETEREKMIQIREGAMNDLLTGRVRLTK